MLTPREYKVLKQLQKFQKRKAQNNSYQPNINIITDDFFEHLKYKQHTINLILKSLDTKGYIVDIFNKIPTSVHTIEITDEGKDALDSYYKLVLFDCLKFLGGAVTAIIIEHLPDIIQFFNSLIST